MTGGRSAPPRMVATPARPPALAWLDWGTPVHDYHAVQGLVRRLLETPEGAAGITAVSVRASPVFSPEALTQAYEILTAGTPLAGTRLELEDLPDRRTCASCGSSFAITRDDVVGHLVVCPSCGEPSDLEVGNGLRLVGVQRRP